MNPVELCYIAEISALEEELRLVKQRLQNYTNPVRNKVWRNENSDKAKKCQDEYNKRNPDKIKTSKKNYYENNKEAILEKNREYYQKNKERIIEKKKEKSNAAKNTSKE